MESLKESLEKISLSDILNANKTRKPLSDEYIKSGLIFCKRCKTAREAIINHKGETYKVNINCKCQQDRLKKAEEKQRIWSNQSKNIKGLDDLGLDISILTKYGFKDDDKSKPTVSKYIAEYVRNFEYNLKHNRGILFSGSVGTGKTFYSRIIGNELHKRGYLILPLRITDLMKLYSNLKNSEKTQRLERMLKTYDLVIIDDLGAERQTEFATEKIFDVFDIRYEAEKPLIVTTNLTNEDINNSSIEVARIFDRITSMCKQRFLLNGQSKRIKE